MSNRRQKRERRHALINADAFFALLTKRNLHGLTREEQAEYNRLQALREATQNRARQQVLESGRETEARRMGEHDNPHRYQPMPREWHKERHALVDKKFTDEGLNADEAARLEAMNQEYDEFQEATPFQQWQTGHNDRIISETIADLQKLKGEIKQTLESGRETTREGGESK